MMVIKQYEEKYKEEIIALILNIQQIEFNVPLTIEDQPDLLEISNFYIKDKGNFWVALFNDKVIGTIALIDCGQQIGTIRKMFVDKDFRGKEFGVGQALLNILENWATENKIRNLYLGTNERLHAAIRFYKKNAYTIIEKSNLPSVFPLMQVDTLFFEKEILIE